jgi:LDH2 family malate/lactate/ureidoglycolate dehydrogenase
VHHLWEGNALVDELAARAPGIVFRSIGLGAVCQAVGGFLAGVPARAERATRRWPGANQGAFLLALDITRFLPLEQFKEEMDDYARQVRRLSPLDGHETALLPGALEWQREHEWAREGVPVGEGHREILQTIGTEFGVAAPF